MLAADRSLLEVNLRQSAIKLREKELNLYTENFSAMATQVSQALFLNIPFASGSFLGGCYGGLHYDLFGRDANDRES
jgi:hypothetical protein